MKIIFEEASMTNITPKEVFDKFCLDGAGFCATQMIQSDGNKPGFTISGKQTSMPDMLHFLAGNSLQQKQNITSTVGAVTNRPATVNRLTQMAARHAP